jgi:hypothetical protein
MTNLVKVTTDLSIVVQIITTLLGVIGLVRRVSPSYLVLQQILGLETFVQIVELIFYIVFIRSSMLSSMAEVRYFDWFITTPTMLITSAIYYRYEENIHKGKSTEKLSLTEFLKENTQPLLVIVTFNFLMLLFGYLGERNALTKLSSTVGGFVFLFASFYTLYERYAKHSPIGNNLFLVMFIIWNIYGIAFLFTPTWKNITFNGLDIIAKNFFGVYLYYKLTTVDTPMKTEGDSNT